MHILHKQFSRPATAHVQTLAMTPYYHLGAMSVKTVVLGMHLTGVTVNGAKDHRVLLRFQVLLCQARKAKEESAFRNPVDRPGLNVNHQGNFPVICWAFLVVYMWGDVEYMLLLCQQVTNLSYHRSRDRYFIPCFN